MILVSITLLQQLQADSGSLIDAGDSMKLIENWRKAHRMSSMQLMALAMVADGLLSALDRFGYQLMSPGWQTAVTMALIAAAMLARVVAQESVR